MRARIRYSDMRDQSFARPIVPIQTHSAMNKPRREITATSKYCGLVTEAALGWDVCTRVIARDKTLRNINILAVGAHWRLPKCPDGASADQVLADYGGRRNHPCVDCRCCVYYAGGRMCDAKEN